MKKRILESVIVIAFTSVLCISCYRIDYNNAMIEHENKLKVQKTISQMQTTCNNALNIAETVKSNIENGKYHGTLQELEFIVEVTSVNNKDGKTIIRGNTINPDKYMGIIDIVFDKNISLDLYKTYKFSVEPLMSMTKPTKVNGTSVELASDEDAATLEVNKQTYSNYAECSVDYDNMTLDEIIDNGNENYPRWTDEQIVKYQETLALLGYTSDNEKKSEVFTIEQRINGEAQ